MRASEALLSIAQSMLLTSPSDHGADREPRSVHLGFEIEHAEHLHSVRRYRVFVMNHADMPKP
jgi:hypothetical protein